MDDTTRVLVGYATAAGSTAGIAERIAGRLQEAGCEVVCRPVGPELDPTAFDALVVGSAVHNMAWLEPAVDFLSRIPLPQQRSTWCFSVGGVSRQGALSRRMTAGEVRRVERDFPAGFRPREHRYFGGIVEMAGLPAWGRLFWQLIGGRPGDHRDWPAIDRWASQIGAEVTGARHAVGRLRG
jgi:menaquinone-dependent protoporphyrinogen oxidase